MRSLVALLASASAVAASHFGAKSDNWRDYEWSYRPEKSADWYKNHEQPLPKLAEPITTVAENKSYVVKLECVGCPFRVREYGQVYEYWQQPPQENSLLLNFTIDDNDRTLLLNGQGIAPLRPMPLHIYAYQTPANLSAKIMSKIVDMQMLDKSWVVGTKYGTFSLEYEHAQLATEVAHQAWLQFDVAAVHMEGQNNPGSYSLSQEKQKTVQLLLSREMIDGQPTLVIKEVGLVERKDRQQPITMPCGKKAIVLTSFNPLQWDYYGKFGTTERKMHVILWGIGEFFDRNGLFLIITAVISGVVILVRWIQRRKNRQTISLQDDAEAALLDAPPAYTDEFQAEELKEEDVQKLIEESEEAVDMPGETKAL